MVTGREDEAASEPIDGLAAVLATEAEEIWNRRRLARLTELLAADHLYHDPLAAGLVVGPERVRERVATVLAAFPDAFLTIEDAFVVDGRALIRWAFAGTNRGPLAGAAPTGRRVLVTGMHLFRLAGAQIAETWPGWDSLSGLRQLRLVDLVLREANPSVSPSVDP